MNPTSLRTSMQSFLAWFGPLRVFLRGIIFIYIKLLMVINRGLQFYGHWRIRWSQLISGSCREYYVLEAVGSVHTVLPWSSGRLSPGDCRLSRFHSSSGTDVTADLPPLLSVLSSLRGWYCLNRLSETTGMREAVMLMLLWQLIANAKDNFIVMFF